MSKKKKPKKNAQQPALPPPSPPTWREKYWKPLITVTEVAIACGFWAAGVAVSDYVISGTLLGIGAFVALIGIWAETRLKLRGQIIYSTVAVAIFGLGGGIVFVRHDAGSAPTLPALEAQVKEFQSLQQFLSGNEGQLRNKFDFPNLLDLNINVQSDRIKWNNAGNSDRAFPYPNQSFVHVAKGHYNASHGKIFMGEKLGPNGVGLKEGPEDVFLLSGTSQNTLAMAQLDGFLKSPLVPENVKVPLRELQKAVNDNIDLMFSVLGERRKQDVRYFSQYRDYDTPFGDIISNEYFSKFHNLEPAANDALRKIQAQLKTG